MLRSKGLSIGFVNNKHAGSGRGGFVSMCLQIRLNHILTAPSHAEGTSFQSGSFWQRHWTKLISNHVKCGDGRQALSIYKQMREGGVLANGYTFAAALKACSTIPDLQAGRNIHAHVLQSMHEIDIIVTNTLLATYAKCGRIVESRLLFEKMSHRDVVSWNAMIMGYAQMGMGESALQLYGCMQQEGFAPDDRTFVAALKACGSLAAQEGGIAIDGELLKLRCLEQGRAIHAQVINSGFESNTFVSNTLLDMYSKCGSMWMAQQIFQKMQSPDPISWTTMIMGYAQNGMGGAALELYSLMQNEGFMPNTQTFVAALKACSNLAKQEGMPIDSALLKIRYLERGRTIHAEVAKCGCELDLFVASTLVDMYAKCGSIMDASQVFEKLVHRDVVSWNSMIMAYAEMDMEESAMELYMCMQREGFTPDDHTFVAALKACGNLAAQEEGMMVDGELLKVRCLKQGRAIHAQVSNRFGSNMITASALLDMYAKCGSMVYAREVFEKMQHRDVVSWTSMIMWYAQTDMGEVALELYVRMQHEGFMPNARTFVSALKACVSLVPQEGNQINSVLNLRCLRQVRTIHGQVADSGLESDIFVANTLVDIYAKCGNLIDALWVFEKMVHPDVVSWTAMIMGYAQMEMGELALKLYVRMQDEGFTPNARTFVAALKACGSISSLKTGKEIHAQIHRFGLENEPFIATSLVDMYSKCGSMEDAQRFFDSLVVRDYVTWGALLAGYSGQGDSGCVFNLYKRMEQEGLKPVGITFISVLAVCSHKGLVEDGQSYFRSMCLKYGIVPSSEHYMSMVDLLGRAGHLDEAVAMVKKTPYRPDTVTWMTILGTCRKWNYVEIGVIAFQCAIMLDEEFAAPYVLMTNICAISSVE